MKKVRVIKAWAIINDGKFEVDFMFSSEREAKLYTCIEGDKVAPVEIIVKEKSR